MNQSLSNTNRTKWPLTGGSLLLDVEHPWAITYVNLGLGGDNTTTFNISLVPNFNQTGNGTFCLPSIKLPSNLVVSNGTQASLQVIQIGETGGSLYNVRFFSLLFPSKTPTSKAFMRKELDKLLTCPSPSVRRHRVQLRRQNSREQPVPQLHRCRWFRA